jgi:hypothetical protein
VSKAGGFLVFKSDHFRTLECERPWFKVVMCEKRLKFVGAAFQYHHPSMLILAGAAQVPNDLGAVLAWE